MPLPSLDDRVADKLDDMHNLGVLMQKLEQEHFKYSNMHHVFTVVILNTSGLVKEMKDLYLDYSSITIRKVACTKLWC
jgi:hypothetical protein